MTHIIAQPAIWLLSLLAGLSQISETVYSPSLPEIARALFVPESWVEYTLTIYLFGFAIGSLFWGKVSDRYGRKPCIIVGMIIYIIGCLGCYFSISIELLLISRFVQAIGGGVGSVLSQAMTHDAFHGAQLGKVFSTVGSALAVFPAIGPVIGGVIAQNFGWQAIFLFLLIFGIILLGLVIYRLPETLHHEKRQRVSTWHVIKRMCTDSQVLTYGLVIGTSFGICFSYYGEGSFYLIDLLGLTPSAYGVTFIAIAGATVVGGIISRALHHYYNSYDILLMSLQTMFLASCTFTLAIVTAQYVSASTCILILLTIMHMMIIMAGICISTSTALSVALQEYRQIIGTATSLFVFFYFILISLFTLIMGLVRNDNLATMPTYFMIVSIGALIIFKRMITKPPQHGQLL